MYKLHTVRVDVIRQQMSQNLSLQTLLEVYDDKDFIN